jgi:hypothetical protein
MAIAFTILLTLGACATPPSVTNLAKKTSANVSLVNSSITAYAERNKRSAERRSAYIADVNQAAIDLESEYAARMGALKPVEDKKQRAAGTTKTARVETTLSYLDELKEIEDTAEAKQAAFQKDLEEARTRNDLSTEEMKALAKSLSVLAKEKSANEMLDFLKKFLKETVTTLNASEDEAERANADAEASTDALAGAVVKTATDEIAEAKKNRTNRTA